MIIGSDFTIGGFYRGGMSWLEWSIALVDFSGKERLATLDFKHRSEGFDLDIDWCSGDRVAKARNVDSEGVASFSPVRL